jgi:hypothetical protein
MKKNVSGQVVGIQLISKTDGSAVTSGTTTIYVTGDGGTQAAGSVGSGACTHEGNGFWTYAPAQAETNYDHIAFTFVNTSACNATVQVYPSFPQTGDSFARIGAPAGASVSADVAAVKAETASIQTDTNDIQTRIPAALVSGRMDASVGAMAANVMTAAAAAADLTTELQSGLATDALLTTVAGYLDTEIAAIKAKTDNLPAAPAATGDIPTAATIADAVWDEVLSGHLTAGSTGNALNAAGSAGDPWSTALPGAYGAGTAGKIIGDNINATISSRASQTSLDTVDDFLDTEIAAIKTKTDQLTFTVANKIDANMLAISGSATAADNLESGGLGLVPGTCATGSTTTSIVTNLTEATDDHYNGRVITFTSGALAGQTTSISDYNGTTKTLTVVALTEAAADTDSFVIS